MKHATKLVRPLRSGQITIPAEFRAELEINEHTMLQVELVSGELHIRPVRVTQRGTGSEWVRELYDLFAPARKSAAGKSNAEINADIEAAVTAVRRKRAKSRS